MIETDFVTLLIKIISSSALVGVTIAFLASFFGKKN